MSWEDNARCKGQDPELFFMAGNPATALRMCWGDETTPPCPVRQQCLDAACKVDPEIDRWGIFGGATPPERARYRFGIPINPKEYNRRLGSVPSPRYRHGKRTTLTGFEHEGLQ